MFYLKNVRMQARSTHTRLATGFVVIVMRVIFFLFFLPISTGRAATRTKTVRTTRFSIFHIVHRVFRVNTQASVHTVFK
jgi:hypothetical protein